MNKYIEKYPVQLLLVLSLCLFFFHLGVIAVSIMEARNFVTSREMLTQGHWLLTTLNNIPRYQKPPLPSWIGSVFGCFLGKNNMIAYRIPTALMATCTIMAWYFVSKLISGSKKISFISAVILATSFYFYAIQREAPTDMYAHGFMVMALYFLFQLFNKHTQLWQNAILAAVFFGASFLSKGPISLYALFLPFIIAYAIVFKFKNTKPKILPFIVFFILAGSIGLWWFIYVRIADPEAFMAIATKETANWASYNVRPFYYYWSFFTQTGIWTIPALLSLFYPYLKNKVANKKAYLFSFIWTIGAVVLLSIIPEKKARYLFPVLIPLALNISFYIAYIIRSFPELKSKKDTYPVYFNFGFIAIIAIVAPIALVIMAAPKITAQLPWFIVFGVLSVSIGILIFLQLKKRNMQNVFLLTVAFVVNIFVFGFPLAKIFYTNTTYNKDTQRITQAQDDVIYSYGEHTPELYWIYGKITPQITDGSILQLLHKNSVKVLVSLEKDPDFKHDFESRFNITKLAVYDLNYSASPKEKGYKNRLVSTLYQLERKQDEIK